MTGTVHIRLGLYTAVSGLSALKQEVMPNVQVTSGLFNVTPATFTVTDFNGDARWLQIEVSSDAGNTYTIMNPRQRVTYSPYSIYATKAGTAVTVSGAVPASQISGFISPASMGTGTISQVLNFSPASGAPFTVGGTTKVTNLNSDLFDGLDSSVFLQKSGGTMTGTLNLQNPAVVSFGNLTRQMLNLYNLDYGIGVQTDTLYQRSANDFSWFKGGLHSDLRNTAGTGGSETMRLNGNGLLWLKPNSSQAPRGSIQFGDLNGSLPYAAIGEAQDEDDVLEIVGREIRIRTNSNGAKPSINFGATTGQFIELFKNGSDTYGIGIQSGTQYYRTGSQFAWFKGGVHNDAGNNAGAGGSTLMTLGSGGELDVRGSASGYGLLNRDNQSKRWVMYSRNSGATDQIAFYSSTAGGDVASFSPNGDLYLVGALTTTVLTIRGGADVAEPFDMTGPEEMEPGSVVVIDEANAGKLKLSTTACDTRVAGIISGAGGVQPGLRLHQEGVMEGDHHVALSGRVYVKAENSHGIIKPGDLLTTSDLPGRAMKVTDHAGSQGAILGKAMSPLDESTGLVLVLVTLQ